MVQIYVEICSPQLWAKYGALFCTPTIWVHSEQKGAAPSWSVVLSPHLACEVLLRYSSLSRRRESYPRLCHGRRSPTCVGAGYVWVLHCSRLWSRLNLRSILELGMKRVGFALCLRLGISKIQTCWREEVAGGLVLREVVTDQKWVRIGPLGLDWPFKFSYLQISERV